MKKIILALVLFISTINATKLVTYKILKIEERVKENSIDFCLNLDRYFTTLNKKLFKEHIKVTPAGFYNIESYYDTICIKKLKPQTKYSIEIDKNAPIGNNFLDKNYKFVKKSSNYLPSIEFKESGYILPSKANLSIPISSINVKRVELKLYRVNRNNLVNTLNNTSFREKLYRYALEQIEYQDGYLLWSKYLNIESKDNKKVTTAIPVGKTIKVAKPGIYILSAAIVDDKGDTKESITNQWFMISDIGLFTLEDSKKLHIYTKHLSNATPYKKVKLELIAKNNELLATTISKKGYATFDIALLRGKKSLAPKAIYAYGDSGDFSLLDFNKAPLDLSDRGDNGRTSNRVFDALIYSDKEIFKPASSVKFHSLIRDSKGRVAINIKVGAKLLNSKRETISKKLLTSDTLGHIASSFKLPNVSGRYTIELYSNSETIGIFNFSAEDFIPPKIEANFIKKITTIYPNSKYTFKLKVNYLTKEPLSEPSIDYTLTLRSIKSPLKEYENYIFGKESENTTNEYLIEKSIKGDKDGNVTIDIDTNFGSKDSITKPLALYINASIKDPAGRAIVKGLEIPYIDKKGYIGIKPKFDDKRVELNTKPSFDIIYIKDSNLTDRDINYQLVELEPHYNWKNSGENWEYYVTYSDIGTIEHGKISLLNSPTNFMLDKLNWGEYRLILKDNNSSTTSIRFAVGYDQSSSTISPDRLPISINKNSFSDGEDIEVLIKPKFSGPININIATDTIIERKEIIAKENEPVVVKFKANKEWGSSAYILATAFRAQSKKLGASRAVGLAHFFIDSNKRELKLNIKAPKQIGSKSDLNITIEAQNLEDRDGYVTIAIVDNGILNITNYKSPDPKSFFFGKKRVYLTIKDIYSELIKAHGEHAEFDVGSGDIALLNKTPTANKRKIVSYISKAIKFNKKGLANLKFKVPDFQGSLSVMAIAWSKDSVGSSNQEVKIKDPLSIESYMPKYLKVGDISSTLVEIKLDKTISKGEYKIEINSTKSLNITPKEFTLNYQNSAILFKRVTLNAKSVEDANITISAFKDGKLVNSRGFKLAINEALPKEYIRKVGILDSKVTLDTKTLLNAKRWRNIDKVNITLSSNPLIATTSIKKELIAYCCRCAEQTSSRALALLKDKESVDIVNSAISRVYELQKYDGGFSLWSSSNASLWVTSYVIDFLTSAQENGFEVSQKRIDSALKYLERNLNKWSLKPKEVESNAYALYILAKNKHPLMSEINYHLQHPKTIKTSATFSYLAATFSTLGEEKKAKELFTKAKEYLGAQSGNYGGELRDKALLIYLLQKANFKDIYQPLLIDFAQDIKSKKYLTTQEMSLALLVSKNIKISSDKLNIKIEDKSINSSDFTKSYTIKNLPKISNLANNSIWYNITTTANAVDNNSSKDIGFSIKKELFDVDGKPLDLKNIPHSKEVVVVISGKIKDKSITNPLIIDLTPAALEIENPNITGFNTIESLKWLNGLSSYENIEYRDDRFIAALTPNSRGKFKVAYATNAANLGEYTLAPSTIVDIYNPRYRASSKISKVVVKKSKDIKSIKVSNSKYKKALDYQYIFTKPINNLKTYTTLELYYLRNAIFAHSGLDFKTINPLLDKIYKKFTWYKPTTVNSYLVYNKLTDIEKNNIQKLLNEEKKRLSNLTLSDFYKVNKTLLDKNYLKRYSLKELKLLRNSLIARYGYIFKDIELKTLFNNLPWYKPNIDAKSSNIIDNKLNPIEHANLIAIIELEKEIKEKALDSKK